MTWLEACLLKRFWFLDQLEGEDKMYSGRYWAPDRLKQPRKTAAINRMIVARNLPSRRFWFLATTFN